MTGLLDVASMAILGAAAALGWKCGKWLFYEVRFQLWAWPRRGPNSTQYRGYWDKL